MISCELCDVEVHIFLRWRGSRDLFPVCYNHFQNGTLIDHSIVREPLEETEKEYLIQKLHRT